MNSNQATSRSTQHGSTRSFTARALALAALGAALCAGSAASATQVWVAPAAFKVRPSTPMPANAPGAAVLAAAKNEFESFHVVVQGPASGVSMTLSGLTDSSGHTISGKDVVLYREALINVTSPSGGDGATGAWPDALIPDVDPIAGEKRNAFPFDVPSGESRSVFVDVHVPAGTPAGTYTGSLSVSGGAAATVPVTLTVWDFALPSTSTLRSAFGMAWNGPCIGHHGDSGCSDYANEEALRSRYLVAALDNRISIDTPGMGAPVNTAGVQSWGDYDAAVGPFLDGTAPTRLQGARLTSARIQSPIGFGNTPMTAGWSQHFKAKGWYPSLYNYVCDEPPLTCAFNEIDGRIAQSKAGDPALPTLVTTTVQRAQQNGVKNIDIYAPVLNWMDDRPNSGLYSNPQRGLYGGDVWWYQSCMSFGCAGINGGYGPGSASYESGWPSYAIDTDGTRNRSQEWLSFVYGMSGEVYYETTTAFFTGNAWTNLTAFGGTGDGTLFYPGTPSAIGGQTDIPVESLRLKGIRDGMEDFELMAYARSLGLGTQARDIAVSVFPHTYTGVSNAAALDAARAQLAQLILHALGKDASPTPTPTPPPATTPPTTPPAATPPATPPANQPGATSGSNTPVALSGAGGLFGQGGQSAQPSLDQRVFGTGCSSAPAGSRGGAQAAWIVVPFVVLGLLRRKKLA